MNHYTRQFLCALWMLVPIQLHAQSTLVADTEPPPDARDTTMVNMEILKHQLDEQNQRIQHLEQEQALAASQAQRQKLADEAKDAKLEAALLELEQLNIVVNQPAQERKLNIYGFFDTTFYKAWYQQKNSVLRTQNPPFSTFTMSHVNVYFNSQMTDTLSALVETGFSFAPLGYESQLPVDAYIYDANTGQFRLSPDLIDDSKYSRVDTTIPGGLTSTSTRYGSVSIVRAHLDWTPRDWFNFRVGQFLTPYGIWNVEHASTVLLGVFYPTLMNFDLVPNSQLGLQAFGNLFPTDMLQLSYALTLSNGRGPMSTVMDLDENKGMGARLQTTLVGNSWKVTAGSYGYYGKYTDAERRPEVYLNADLTRHYENGSPLGGGIAYLNKFKEYIITADLAIEVGGLKLFGEFVHRKVLFLIRPEMDVNAQFVQTGNFNTARRAANHYSQSAYAILSYTLPIPAIDPVKFTPYVGVDWMAPDDPLEWYERKSFRFGLNFQPSPYTAIKAEGNIDNFAAVLGGRMTSIAAQLAVSF